MPFCIKHKILIVNWTLLTLPLLIAKMLRKASINEYSATCLISREELTCKVSIQRRRRRIIIIITEYFHALLINRHDVIFLLVTGIEIIITKNIPFPNNNGINILLCRIPAIASLCISCSFFCPAFTIALTANPLFSL